MLVSSGAFRFFFCFCFSFLLPGQAKLSDLPLRPLMDVSRIEWSRIAAEDSESRNEAVPDVADNAVLSSGTYQLQKAAHPWQLVRSGGDQRAPPALT